MKAQVRTVVAIASLAALFGCATTTPKGGPAPQIGVASYYGEAFHGRRTANGERYDMKALTAAHPTLPFGSKVRVTNLQNGRSVVVRINDRGPYAEKRVIDLSYAAARELRILDRGTAKVRLEVLAERRPDKHP